MKHRFKNIPSYFFIQLLFFHFSDYWFLLVWLSMYGWMGWLLLHAYGCVCVCVLVKFSILNLWVIIFSLSLSLSVCVWVSTYLYRQVCKFPLPASLLSTKLPY